MKVYIVQSCDYDDTSIWSVHESRETAEAEKQRRDDDARLTMRRANDRIVARYSNREPVSDEMIEDCRNHYMVSEWDVQP